MVTQDMLLFWYERFSADKVHVHVPLLQDACPNPEKSEDSKEGGASSTKYLILTSCEVPGIQFLVRGWGDRCL